MNKLSQPLIGNQSNYLFYIHKKHKQHDHSNTLWPNNLLHLRFLYQCNYAIDRRFPCQWAEIHHMANEHSISQRTNLLTLLLWTKRSRICDQTAMIGLEERQSITGLMREKNLLINCHLHCKLGSSRACYENLWPNESIQKNPCTDTSLHQGSRICDRMATIG